MRGSRCEPPCARLVHTVAPDVCVDTPLGGSIRGVALRGRRLLLTTSLPRRRPSDSRSRQRQQRALQACLGALLFVTRQQPRAPRLRASRHAGAPQGCSCTPHARRRTHASQAELATERWCYGRGNRTACSVYGSVRGTTWTTRLALGRLHSPPPYAITQGKSSNRHAQHALAAAHLPYQQAVVGVAELGKRRLARAVHHRRRAANHDLRAQFQTFRTRQHPWSGGGEQARTRVFFPGGGRLASICTVVARSARARGVHGYGAHHLSRNEAGAVGPLVGRAVKRVEQLWVASARTLMCTATSNPHAP